MPRTNHSDIRIGTLASASKGTAYLKQILPHGFESFSLTFWKTIDVPDLETLGKECRDLLGDKAVISTLGMFGNPLRDDVCLDGWRRCIDACKHFGCAIVDGFAGAIEGKPVPESMPRFKEVWGELAKRAEDAGVRLALENCDMGGTWNDARWNIAHAPTAWEMMFNEVPSPALGLEWEPCHQMVSLIDPLPNLRACIKKVFHVHGKDASIDWHTIKTQGIRSGKSYVHHRTPGFGDTNWTDVISILRQNNYEGTIDIEGWHDPVYSSDLEMTGQVFALNYLKQCRGGPFVPNPE